MHIIYFLNSRSLTSLNKNINFPFSLLDIWQGRDYVDCSMASNLQLANQFTKDKIESRLTFLLVLKAVLPYVTKRKITPTQLLVMCIHHWCDMISLVIL